MKAIYCNYEYVAVHQTNRPYLVARYPTVSGRQFKAPSSDNLQHFLIAWCDNARMSNDFLFYRYQHLSCQCTKWSDRLPFSLHFYIFIHLQAAIRKVNSSPLIYFFLSGLKACSHIQSACTTDLQHPVRLSIHSRRTKCNAPRSGPQQQAIQPSLHWPSKKKPLIYSFALLDSLFA